MDPIAADLTRRPHEGYTEEEMTHDGGGRGGAAGSQGAGTQQPGKLGESRVLCERLWAAWSCGHLALRLLAHERITVRAYIC